MPKKRDVIEEIRNKRVRSNFATKYDYSHRFYSIKAFIESISLSSDNVNEALRYIPLGSIAATETYFRLLYQDLVDLGEPYFSRAITYIKDKGNIKFDLDFLIAIQGKQVTVGEIFSHILPLNNLDDIHSTVSALISEDLYVSLRKAQLSDHYSLGDESRIFKRNFGSYVEAIKYMFETRHILAHEFADKIELSKEYLLNNFNKLFYFIEVCDFVINKATGRYVKPTNSDMIYVATKGFKKSDSELNKLIKQIRVNYKESNSLYNPRVYAKAILKWKEFRELYASSFRARYDDGGAFAELVYLINLEEVTKGMISNLREWNKHSLR